MWHLGDAWSRRTQPNVVLVHYSDLLSDLEGEMGRLAEELRITISASELERLAVAASFEAMRHRSGDVAPGGDVLKSPAAFFRRGRSGAGAEALSPHDLAAYERRARELAPEDLLAWLHR